MERPHGRQPRDAIRLERRLLEMRRCAVRLCAGPCVCIVPPQMAERMHELQRRSALRRAPRRVHADAQRLVMLFRINGEHLHAIRRPLRAELGEDIHIPRRRTHERRTHEHAPAVRHAVGIEF